MRLWIGLLGLPMLAACHQGAATSNNQTAAASTITAPTLPTTPLAAGQWEITTSTEQVGAPGMPTAPTTSETPAARSVCVSPADAAEPSPELLMGSINRDECHREVWGLERGNINGVLVCAGHAEDIHSVPTRISGNYTNQTYSLQVESQALGLTIRQRIEGRRTGTCTP